MVYYRLVELTATNFRKHLFQVLERAADGETIDITWKGSCGCAWLVQKVALSWDAR